MQQITINTYKYKELSKEAKEKVINKFQDINVNYDWWEFIIDNLTEEIKEKLNIDIDTKDIHFEMLSRDNNIHIESKTLISALSQKYPKLLDFDIPEKFGLFCNYLGGGLCSSLNESEYKEEYIELEEEFNESEEIDKEVEIVQNKKIKEDIMDNLRVLHNILKDYYNKLYEEYNYAVSEEAIVESLNVNEMMFKENGEVV
tara:strand:+ start:302 stop:904 length:603 start_codon:yes stop_codon:yes gene_type:complete